MAEHVRGIATQLTGRQNTAELTAEEDVVWQG
jgi:hypothetical protein